MRVLTEKELMLVSGGQTTVEEVPDPIPGEFDWLGSNGGYTGPTWTSGNTSVTVGGSSSGGDLAVGGGVTIKF